MSIPPFRFRVTARHGQGREINVNESLSVFIAFGAGLLSFLSPCVLPLIPSYLCVIGGTTSMSDGQTNSGAFKLGLAARTVSFILGFSAVFIAISIIISTTFMLMGGVSIWINIISGSIVIVLGLNIIFDFLKFLNYEKRFHFTPKKSSSVNQANTIADNAGDSSGALTRHGSVRARTWLAGMPGAFVAGAAFGAGWTPCVGPILSGILVMAAQSHVSTAILYLVFYSLGLGLPFLLASLFFSVFLQTSKKIRKYLPLIRKISGLLLIIIGILIITGYYQALNIFLSRSVR